MCWLLLLDLICFRNSDFQKNNNKTDMPNVSTLSAFKVELNKTSGPHSYVVTGNRTAVQGLEYYKYLASLTNKKHINVAHPNETFTDLFLIV